MELPLGGSWTRSKEGGLIRAAAVRTSRFRQKQYPGRLKHHRVCLLKEAPLEDGGHHHKTLFAVNLSSGGLLLMRCSSPEAVAWRLESAGLRLVRDRTKLGWPEEISFGIHEYLNGQERAFIGFFAWYPDSWLFKGLGDEPSPYQEAG